VCGGPALEPTADRVNTYIKGVKGSVPDALIGLIEAYPFSSEAQIETMLDLLRARGALPAFLHVDVDLNAVRGGIDLAADMKRLKDACASQKVPFGVIIWGNNGDVDALYALDAGRLLNRITEAFPTPADAPDHLIVQSWAVSRSGLSITPANLPEDADFTHTNLLWYVFRRFRGETGPSTGSAIIRR
jgi:hypothetical protein